MSEHEINGMIPGGLQKISAELRLLTTQLQSRVASNRAALVLLTFVTKKKACVD